MNNTVLLICSSVERPLEQLFPRLSSIAGANYAFLVPEMAEASCSHSCISPMEYGGQGDDVFPGMVATTSQFSPITMEALFPSQGDGKFLVVELSGRAYLLPSWRAFCRQKGLLLRVVYLRDFTRLYDSDPLVAFSEFTFAVSMLQYANDDIFCFSLCQSGQADEHSLWRKITGEELACHVFPDLSSLDEYESLHNSIPCELKTLINFFDDVPDGSNIKGKGKAVGALLSLACSTDSALNMHLLCSHGTPRDGALPRLLSRIAHLERYVSALSSDHEKLKRQYETASAANRTANVTVQTEQQRKRVPVQTGFPNAAQKFLLLFYQPCLKIYVKKEVYQRYKKNPEIFFAHTRSGVNKALLKVLKLFGPVPKLVN